MEFFQLLASGSIFQLLASESSISDGEWIPVWNGNPFDEFKELSFGQKNNNINNEKSTRTQELDY